jgi:hypothetical protein
MEDREQKTSWQLSSQTLQPCFNHNDRNICVIYVNITRSNTLAIFSKFYKSSLHVIEMRGSYGKGADISENKLTDVDSHQQYICWVPRYTDATGNQIRFSMPPPHHNCR